MAERRGPAVYTIPAHRAFSDALAAGIIAQHGKDALELARGTILLPNNRAMRALSEAFVRQSGGGLLMPRLVPIGDENLGERLGNALDPLGEGLEVPPAIGGVQRQMILARLVQQVRQAAGRPVDAGEAMRLGQALGQVIDQMLIARVEPRRLRELEGQATAELSGHWQASLQLLELLLERWPEELRTLGMIDLAERRNRLLDHVAKRWQDAPPGSFVIAAGISTTAPAICAVLRTVSRMERGQLVLAELDQNMSAEEWDAIGPFEPDPVRGRQPRAQESHPQYNLKQMLERIGVARDEVALWRWGGGHDARAVRSRNISNAMLPPVHTVKWRDLKPEDRRLSGVRLLEVPTPAMEAQAVALMLREALEKKDHTAALVTPDRALAARVSAHLERWGVHADDSAGQPLHLTPPGTLLLAIAQVAADRFAPVSLLGLLKHPLVGKGEERLPWLEQVRGLDQLLRGPRPAPGLEGLDARLAASPLEEKDRQAPLREEVRLWWPSVREMLGPLETLDGGAHDLSAILALLRECAGALSGEQVWAGYQGRALADLFADMEAAAPTGPRAVDMRALPDLLRRLMEPVAVRPPRGGHPRIAIYGLLEARLQQADLMILAGLNEGTWPGLPAPDPWLAPRIRQELGLPGLEQRIGLAAHDFASALGAPEVVVTRSRRSGNAPAIASRFWLRLQAMAGDTLKQASQYGDWADRLDRPATHRPTERPKPRPPLALRPKQVAVTQVDRLAADPYAFYAQHILKLRPLDRVDADPGPAWRGSLVHEWLEHWFREDACAPGKLVERAVRAMASTGTHPLLRALWLPRLKASLEWIEEQVVADRSEGRTVLTVETEGKITLGDVLIKGTADRIDAMPGGGIAIIDYKTGKPPSAKQVAGGFALQLGLLGLIAERGGFPDLTGQQATAMFEYWSTGKAKGAFGYRYSPVAPGGSARKMAAEELTGHAERKFRAAAARWLTGDAPFIAQLNPELPSYGDYDQLMRLEEWYGREEGGNG